MFVEVPFFSETFPALKNSWLGACDMCLTKWQENCYFCWQIGIFSSLTKTKLKQTKNIKELENIDYNTTITKMYQYIEIWLFFINKKMLPSKT